MIIRTYTLIITLNVNGLNAPTKTNRLAEWLQKQDLYIYCLQETHFRPGDTCRLKVRGWKMIFHANGNQKKAGVAILISNKTDYKIKTITRHKEGYFIMIKGLELPFGIVVKNTPANAGDMGSSPGLGISHLLQSN